MEQSEAALREAVATVGPIAVVVDASRSSFRYISMLCQAYPHYCGTIRFIFAMTNSIEGGCLEVVVMITSLSREDLRCD